MLWFNHPKPADRRKEEAIVADRPVLRFSVRYALPEYLSFMWQHAGYLIRRRRVGRAARWYLLARSTSAAALHFVAQGRSRRTYEFTIDQHGIMRTSAGGVTVLGWDDVKAVRRYSRGYLLVLRQGTLPIPFRCLAAGQGAEIDGFAASFKAAALR